MREEHRVAVLTYRKNVKKEDAREESGFEEMKVESRLGRAGMKLEEKKIIIDKCSMREVRRLSPDGHQTGIITTNKILTVIAIAAGMFGRCIQEISSGILDGNTHSTEQYNTQLTR